MSNKLFREPEQSKVVPVFQKPAICRGTQRVGEILDIKPATRLLWPFPLAAGWKRGSK